MSTKFKSLKLDNLNKAYLLKSRFESFDTSTEEEKE